jgi:hypothetical protein
MKTNPTDTSFGDPRHPDHQALAKEFRAYIQAADAKTGIASAVQTAEEQQEPPANALSKPVLNR